MLSVQDILKATGGALLYGSRTDKIKRISIDSRQVKKGDLFIAILGKNFDGHNFLMDAQKKAAALLVSRKNIKPQRNIPVIYVSDTTKALGHIAKFYRQKFSIPVIAITGSAGKTTTKEIISSVLETQLKVLKNIATENNHIGVPMTILRLKSEHDVLVLELGTNHFGEIRWLAEISNPTIAVFTNIGESHLESFKTPQGVFKEKTELIKYLKTNGTIVFNGDDPYLSNIPKKPSRRYISYSIDKYSQLQADCISFQKSHLDFRVNRKRNFSMESSGRHAVYNALAAIGCGDTLKIKEQNIVKGLRRVKFPAGRQGFLKIKSLDIIDDTYNANPLSFRSALETLESLNVPGRKIVICGDMLELGAMAYSAHDELGKILSQLSLDHVVAIGKLSKFVTLRIQRENPSMETSLFSSVDQACLKLKNILQPKDTLLIKGSRSMKLEKLIYFLKKEAPKWGNRI